MTILTGLAKKLVTNGLLTEDKLLKEIEQAKKNNKNIVSHLVDDKILNALTIAQFSSIEFGIPYLNLDAFDLDLIPDVDIKAKKIEKERFLPIFQRGEKIYIAISDPTNIQILDDIKFQTGLYPEPILVEDNKLTKAIERCLSKKEIDSFSDLDDESLETLDITSDGDNEDESKGGSSSDDAPVVRFVNKILLDAINCSASDIHFEPYEKNYRIRFRQDGILREHTKPPVNLAARISTRLKVMARLDISERRIPQDGRFKMRISKQHTIDFRVSTCPTLYGEKVVTRILDPASAQLGIDVLGFEPFQKELFLHAIKQPQGMILVTGPTGSGKTVTLYTALNILNTPERNISTAEDPIEINLPGINQVNVNFKAGLNFATALRSFLRQDPDVVMVGEVRDLETAETAIKAAQTGHLVFSTLHTNSAPDTISRLINMGVPVFNLATSIVLIVAQRLARKLCENCKQEIDVPLETKIEMGFNEEEAKNLKLYQAVGCGYCADGFKGRIGIYEVMPISKEMAELIMKNANPMELAEQAMKENVWNIRQAGLNKVKQGITTLNEIYRVTKE